MLSWMSRTALEVIGQAGLGYSFDTMANESAAHPYSGILKELMLVVHIFKSLLAFEL
jgi:hypothetical protein